MAASPVRRFLIDGFPRNQDNLDGWICHAGADVDVDFVLFLDCPADVRRRRSGRRLVAARTIAHPR